MDKKVKARGVKNIKKKILLGFAALSIVLFICLVVIVFFDQAVLVRKGTLYRLNVGDKVVALTFDDGPSREWTPKILDELKKAGVKATFFMIGKHVAQYPGIVKRVAAEGHEIGNHSYDHHVIIYYKTDELEKEIRITEKLIKDLTGQTTRYFRPPKAWINNQEKKKIKEMGYEVVLWSLNSKDWVNFDEKYIVRYLLHYVRSGDIILFHDAGGFFGTEGGNRNETVKTIPKLIEKLKNKGYRFVTISELLKLYRNNNAKQ